MAVVAAARLAAQDDVEGVMAGVEYAEQAVAQLSALIAAGG